MLSMFHYVQSGKDLCASFFNILLPKDIEQAIYTSNYEYEFSGLVPGYHSTASYQKVINAVIVQFVSIIGRETWIFANGIGEKATATQNIIYNSIVRIIWS